MTYRPNILILSNNAEQNYSANTADNIMCKWPSGMPPTFCFQSDFDCDVALAFASTETDLLKLLPSLLELHSKDVPVVLCCDEVGSLSTMIEELQCTRVAIDSLPESLAGILFGLLQRNEQVSQLKGQVGFVRKLHESLQEDLDIIQDELETAATIQREFMSNEVQEVHGVEFSTLWRPASIVSGDMYDITQLDEDHVAFFIADAIGHGISAAMLAMMLTRTLSAHRFGSDGKFAQPNEILKHLNAALLERNGNNTRFATAAYGILNCKTNVLVYAGAGHPPALISRFGAEPALLDSDGPLLGVFDTDDFSQRSIQLTQGDTLLLYSDGFEHALGNENYGAGELPTFLRSMHEFCSSANGDVLDSINTYLNSSLVTTAEDDLTMICLRARNTIQTLGLAA
jgi:sigma-B regulation protein RsbU (phosphoserine phosphatase)